MMIFMMTGIVMKIAVTVTAVTAMMRKKKKTKNNKQRLKAWEILCLFVLQKNKDEINSYINIVFDTNYT